MEGGTLQDPWRLKNPMATDERSEPAPRPPTGKRCAFVLLLVTLFGLLAYAAFGPASSILSRFTMGSSVTQFLDVAGPLPLVMRIVNVFQSFWWAFALGSGALAILVWKGALDGLLKPLLGLVILLCLAAGGLVWYLHSLPDKIGEHHAPDLRRRLFGDPLPK